MLFPPYAVAAFVSSIVCALIVATLYLIRRGIAANVSTKGGLFWIRFIDVSRWFFQILLTWFALSAFAPLQVLVFFVFVVLFLQFYATIFWNARERQAIGLLLVQVHKAQGSIPDLLQAYADSNPTLMGAKARFVGEALRRGEPLLAVTDRLRFKLPTTTRLALNTPPSAQSSEMLEASLVTSDPLSVSKVAVIAAYIPFLMLFMSVIFSFFGIAILPTFVEMFEEFELQSPAVELLTWIMRVLLPITISVAILFALYVSLMIFLWMIGFGSTLRFLPILGPLVLRHRRAILLDSLAYATAQQQSLPDAFEGIYAASVYEAERRPLRKCLIDIKRGASMKHVLRRIISKPQARWLEAASHTNHLPETLHDLATLIRMRASRRLEWSVSLLLPILIIVCGFPVLLVCYAVIKTLTDLILGLTLT